MAHGLPRLFLPEIFFHNSSLADFLWQVACSAGNGPFIRRFLSDAVLQTVRSLNGKDCFKVEAQICFGGKMPALAEDLFSSGLPSERGGFREIGWVSLGEIHQEGWAALSAILF
ncbi:MAG: hypothetical protein ACP5OP_07490 [Leptospirillia bacterium]